MRKVRDINKILVENIQIDVYHTWLNIYAYETVGECLFNADLLDGSNISDWEHTDGVFYIHKKSNSWFMAFNWNKINSDTIAHECFHATCAILERKGVVFCKESEEAYAYLLG